ncbi:hypothetical protein [Streptomyces sp. NPDC089919]|uniref:hypothetical protein n=1 Tax=Streptomyces sp. NPDC089919 TaxID=3155188 RepID=UPI003421DE8F
MSKDRLVPAKERSAMLREQLAGGRSEALAPLGREASVLVGTILRACARAEQGLELTDLELRLTEQLDALLGVGAVQEFGRIFQEPGSRASAGLFPDLVTGRGLEQGVDDKALGAWLPSAAQEVLARPEVAVLSLDDLESGALTGSEEVVVVGSRAERAAAVAQAEEGVDAAIN